MTHTAEEWRDQLQALQPPGIALPEDPDSDWGKFLLALGDEKVIVEGDAENLINELDPRTATKTLPVWEYLLELPDPCVEAPLTLQDRRNAIVARLNAGGGQSRNLFIRVAQALGFEIEITECFTNTVDSPCDYPLFDENWKFHFIVKAQVPIKYFYCGQSTCGEPLTFIEKGSLECTLERIRHEHLTAIYAYEDPEE